MWQHKGRAALTLSKSSKWVLAFIVYSLHIWYNQIWASSKYTLCVCICIVFRVDLFCSGKADGEAVLTVQLNLTTPANNFTVLNFKRRKMCYRSKIFSYTFTIIPQRNCSLFLKIWVCVWLWVFFTLFSPISILWVLCIWQIVVSGNVKLNTHRW